VCCCVLQCVLLCVAVCCCVLQCVAVCCSVLQCVTVCLRCSSLSPPSFSLSHTHISFSLARTHTLSLARFLSHTHIQTILSRSHTLAPTRSFSLSLTHTYYSLSPAQTLSHSLVFSHLLGISCLRALSLLSPATHCKKYTATLCNTLQRNALHVRALSLDYSLSRALSPFSLLPSFHSCSLSSLWSDDIR